MGAIRRIWPGWGTRCIQSADEDAENEDEEGEQERGVSGVDMPGADALQEYSMLSMLSMLGGVIMIVQPSVAQLVDRVESDGRRKSGLPHFAHQSRQLVLRCCTFSKLLTVAGPPYLYDQGRIPNQNPCPVCTPVTVPFGRSIPFDGAPVPDVERGGVGLAAQDRRELSRRQNPMDGGRLEAELRKGRQAMHVPMVSTPLSSRYRVSSFDQHQR